MFEVDRYTLSSSRFDFFPFFQIWNLLCSLVIEFIMWSLTAHTWKYTLTHLFSAFLRFSDPSPTNWNSIFFGRKKENQINWKTFSLFIRYSFIRTEFALSCISIFIFFDTLSFTIICFVAFLFFSFPFSSFNFVENSSVLKFDFLKA